MRRYSGEPQFPIWLLGDSNPKNWAHLLDVPLDPRHPARHNIWTSVLDEIQDTVFRTERSRVDTKRFYTQNSIGDPQQKPKNMSYTWDDSVMYEVGEFRKLLGEYKPPLVISFGSFAFEFSRRARGEAPLLAYGNWRTKDLSSEFQKRLKAFNPNTINILPLLHASIARGNFLSSHRDFCASEQANYFEVVGRAIGYKLIEYGEELPIWIE